MAESKSTDKLRILVDSLKHIPTAKLNKVKTFKMKWEYVDGYDGGALVPIIDVTFKD